ncbi:MAG: ABC transporter ATP-binding protein [Bacillota bacterium]|nr:ABC transporter ATP-binding protein [Bacillota bacterium]
MLSLPIEAIIKEYSYAEDFFTSVGIENVDKSLTIIQLVDRLTEEYFEDTGFNKEQLLNHFTSFMQKMDEINKEAKYHIESITILGGYNKLGKKENVNLTLLPGEIICIVGPTGSGKSRLLGDIECLAQCDTPTGRQVLINNTIPKNEKRFSIENKLVAQLSQNMNFVMDITVEEFINMHAESRMVDNINQMVDNIINCANDLAGEKFSPNITITQLSGGQSRALMIADTALLSKSPIVLIDEIENAGIDRKRAIELLVKKEKIILMSTHDPILALMGDKRIVIKNGGMDKIIRTSKLECDNLETLEKYDYKMMKLRNLIRTGKEINFDIDEYFRH